ncbi:TFIIA-domain-containing protein [Ascobolus immersus RN42]|uniref:TFIIA-domain-containing protein n=1 Tax=Ascobolus immersus RN42 TaxID=1160509 RepID=A0A3N4IQ55_ASCIM|nr:TFIIA-domain-containing protein [Ascobolus immersus RN42]
MSSEAVTALYTDIINSVITMSEMDFEDSGLSKGDAQALRSEWQSKLSGFNVGVFPWEKNFREQLIKQEASALCRSAPPNASVLDRAYNQILQDNGGRVPSKPTFFVKKEAREEGPFGGLAQTPPADEREQLVARIAIENIQRVNPHAVIPLAMLKAAGLIGNASSASRHNSSMESTPQPIVAASQSESTPTTGSGLLSPSPSVRTLQTANSTTGSPPPSSQGSEAQGPRSISREAADKLLHEQAGINDEGRDDLDDPALDDNEGSEVEDDDGEVGFEDLMVCEYEKVQRSKVKWKAVFRGGVMNINGRDYVFRKATAEMDW